MISTRRVGSRSSSRTSYDVSSRASMSDRSTCSLAIRRDESQNTGEELVPLADGAGAFGGDEVAEELADDGEVLVADAIDGGLGVAGERAADAADVVVGLAGEQAGLAVALLPQPGGGEGQQRQRAALALDLGQHLVDQLVVLEAVAALQGGLGQGAAEGGTGRRDAAAVSSENTGARASCSWHRIRKSSRMVSSTWTSASSTSRASSSREALLDLSARSA